MTMDEIFHMVCLHEAGHAVVAYALQLPLAPITARMLDANGSWGGFEGTPGPDLHEDNGNPSDREHLEKRIIQCLAGPAAECRYTHVSPFKAGGTDLALAVRLACLRYAYRTEAELFLEVTGLWERTKDLLYDQERWEYVEHIASSLEQQRTDQIEMCRLEPEVWTTIIHGLQCARRGVHKTEVMRIMDLKDLDRIERSLSDSLKP
jgi:hypothetical protein